MWFKGVSDGPCNFGSARLFVTRNQLRDRLRVKCQKISIDSRRGQKCQKNKGELYECQIITWPIYKNVRK